MITPHEDAYADGGTSPPRFLGARLLEPIHFIHSKMLDQRTPWVNLTRESIENAREDFELDDDSDTGGGRHVSGDPRFKHIDELSQHLDLNLGEGYGRASVADIGYQFRSARSYAKRIPLWANNDTKTRMLIERSFPNWKTDPTQRDAAAHWAAIIHLYYRMGFTAAQIATETGSTTLKVHDKIRSIQRAARGLQGNGRPRSKYGRGKHPNCRRKSKNPSKSANPLF